MRRGYFNKEIYLQGKHPTWTLKFIFKDSFKYGFFKKYFFLGLNQTRILKKIDLQIQNPTMTLKHIFNDDRSLNLTKNIFF